MKSIEKEFQDAKDRINNLYYKLNNLSLAFKYLQHYIQHYLWIPFFHFY